MADEFTTTPAGSLVTLEEEQRVRYYSGLFSLPQNLRDLLFSPKTGAYIRGITRSFNLAPDQAEILARTILIVTVGERSLAELSSLLSGQLKIALDKATAMAQEIEHDLFAPVAIELNQYLENRKREMKKIENKATGNPRAAGATNILNLKNKPKPPAPPPIPRPTPRPPVMTNP